MARGSSAIGWGSGLLFLGMDVLEKIYYTGRVQVFVIVRGDQLGELLVDCHAGLDIVDGRASVRVKVL